MSDDLRSKLADVGRRLAEAEQARTEAMAELEQLAREADESGFPLRQVSVLSGVSRTTIYKMLG